MVSINQIEEGMRFNPRFKKEFLDKSFLSPNSTKIVDNRKDLSIVFFLIKKKN